jgi:hypothetical protein
VLTREGGGTNRGCAQRLLRSAIVLGKGSGAWCNGVFTLSGLNFSGFCSADSDSGLDILLDLVVFPCLLITPEPKALAVGK